MSPRAKRYTLLRSDGRPYQSSTPGTLGGHRPGRLYGRLDCPAALRAIARGGYVKNRVFFADEQTAIAAGYRPCAACLPDAHARWKARIATLPASTNRQGRRRQAMKKLASTVLVAVGLVLAATAPSQARDRHDEHGRAAVEQRRGDEHRWDDRSRFEARRHFDRDHAAYPYGGYATPGYAYVPPPPAYSYPAPEAYYAAPVTAGDALVGGVLNLITGLLQAR